MRLHGRGFTLIEVLVTLVLIGLLASVVIPISQVSIQHSKERELKKSLREIREALDAYREAAKSGRISSSITLSGYPPSLAVLVQGVPDLKYTDGRNMYFLRRIPRDPLNQDESVPPEATWGKRSYNSPWDKPREGEDVYDVYSLSPAKGLNGIPYREW